MAILNTKSNSDYHKKYREQHRESIKAKKRAWYAQNKDRLREHLREQSRKSYAHNIDSRRAAARITSRKRWRDNLEVMRSNMRYYSKEWRQKHPERHKFFSRRYDLRQFGMTVESYEQMLLDQNNLCAICHEPDQDGKRLAIDHDHETNRVRGLLCRRCNRAIGAFHDRADLLLSASEYLNHAI